MVQYMDKPSNTILGVFAVILRRLKDEQQNGVRPFEVPPDPKAYPGLGKGERSRWRRDTT